MLRQLGWMAVTTAVAIASVTSPLMRPSLAAETVSVSLGETELLSVPVSELEAYVATGTATGELEPILTLLSDEERGILTSLLGSDIKIKPEPFSQFLDSSLSESILTEVGRFLRSDSAGVSSLDALRLAMNRAAATGTFSLLDVIKAYPVSNMVVDADQGRKALQGLNTFGKDLNLLLAAFGVTVDTSEAQFDLGKITSLIRSAEGYTQQVDRFIENTGITESELKGDAPPAGSITIQKAELYQLYQDLDQLVKQAKDTTGIKVKVDQ